MSIRLFRMAIAGIFKIIMVKKLTQSILLIMIAGAIGVPAFSNTIITNYAGQVQPQSLPASLYVNALESDTTAFAFLERTGKILQAPLSVDASRPGTYSSTATLSPGTIAENTEVDSTIVHVDPVGTHSWLNFSGSLTFSGDILGVIVLSGTLDQSDSILGGAGVTYFENNAYRGLELTPAKDSFTISADLHTVAFNVMTGGLEDEIRVLTSSTFSSPSSSLQATPEPDTISFLALGLAALTAGKFLRKAAV
jgi:hypothetical protein